MTIPFAAFMQRLRDATDVRTQMDLARTLGVNRSAITQAKNRDAVPVKWVLSLSRSHGLNPDWLEFGKGPRRTAAQADRSGSLVKQALANAAALHSREPAPFMNVPQVRARLCAGGGSFELEAIPVALHPLPVSWLARMGTPREMVFMDVVGNSMEPGIMDGDMVLVDQAAKQLSAKSIMAVGFEETIYIKRVEHLSQANGLRLLSDNPDYTPITIQGDELDSFRVIGRVVWLCRNCR